MRADVGDTIIPSMVKATWRERLRRIIDETPGLSMKAVSQKAGLNPGALHDWLSRGQSPSIDAFLSVCNVLGVAPAYLITGEEPYRITVPVVGIVSAGEGWTPVEESQSESVEFDLGGQDVIALEVRGDSMAPVYRNGDVLICDRRTGRHVHNLLGLDCVVRTATGENYVKILKKGAHLGRFNLKSYNPVVDDIENVTLDWAAPVVWIRRGAR